MCHRPYSPLVERKNLLSPRSTNAGAVFAEQRHAVVVVQMNLIPTVCVVVVRVDGLPQQARTTVVRQLDRDTSEVCAAAERRRVKVED